jgi:hypothetical protein
VTLDDFLWSLLVIYFMVLCRIIDDLFTDHELSGLGTTGWISFLVLLPFPWRFAYLMSRGKGMTENAMAKAQASNADQQEY